MAIRFYDQALVDKIKRWTKDSNLTILTPEDVNRMLQVRLDQSNDKPVTLPLISISRAGEVDILQTQKKPMSFDGMMLEATSQKSMQLDAIPISIGYQLDIYTRYYEEGDEYLRNFIFNFINFPKLEITIPYNNSNIKHTANVRVVSPVEDNSDIPERLMPGQFTRWSIQLLIDDAYLFSVPVKNIWSIGGANVEMAKDNSEN